MAEVNKDARKRIAGFMSTLVQYQSRVWNFPWNDWSKASFALKAILSVRKGLSQGHADI